MDTASKADNILSKSQPAPRDRESGVFSISLDFELFWGLHDHTAIDSARDRMLATKKVVPEMISKFSANGIHVTWATVGFLLNDSVDELFNKKPAKLPSYRSEQYSPYRLARDSFNGKEECIVAPELIKMIVDSPTQELGSHTYSHYCCLEEGQTIAEFKADLEHAKKVASKYKVELKSLVFPRNQYSSEHIDAAVELGFTSIRTQHPHWIFEPRPRNQENLFIRGLRFLDSFTSITGQNSFGLPKMTDKDTICKIPASRFLRPYSPRYRFLNRLHLNRVKKSMTVAAKNGKLYHLWWHPHNFSTYTEENLQNLDEIIQHYDQLRREYGFKSLNMSEISEHYAHSPCETAVA